MRLTAPQVRERHEAMRRALKAVGVGSLGLDDLDRQERRMVRASIQAQHDLEVREAAVRLLQAWDAIGRRPLPPDEPFLRELRRLRRLAR